jgi:hypothetical protein
MLKRVVRWLAWALVGVVGLAVAVGLAVVILNLNDQSLDPRAAALLRTPTAGVIEADNGFPDLIGLKAPLDADPREWGERWLAEAATVTSAEAAAAFHAKFTGRPADAVPLFCNPTAAACLERAVSSRAVAVALLQGQEEHLRRYQKLFDYPTMREIYHVATPSAPILGYGGIFASQSLLLGRIAMKVAERDVEGAVDLLERDVALQRRLLIGSTYLLTKTVALEMFTRDMAMLSELLRFRRTEMALHAARAATMAAPLTPAERSMEQALKAEFRVFANFLIEIGQDRNREDLAVVATVPGFLAPRLYQPHASVNLLYRLFEPVFAMDTTKAPRAPGVYEPPFDPAGGWTLPYNVVGKILLARSVPQFADYPSLVADVDGLRRLVVLQAAIIGRGLTNDRVAAYLAEADTAHANPYTGQPMQWDPQTGQLGFEPRSGKWRNQKFGGKPNWLAITL